MKRTDSTLKFIKKCLTPNKQKEDIEYIKNNILNHKNLIIPSGNSYVLTPEGTNKLFEEINNPIALEILGLIKEEKREKEKETYNNVSIDNIIP